VHYCKLSQRTPSPGQACYGVFQRGKSNYMDHAIFYDETQDSYPCIFEGAVEDNPEDNLLPLPINRYVLRCNLDVTDRSKPKFGKTAVAFLLNPTKEAREDRLDSTLRKLIARCKELGYRTVFIINLFGHRDKKPAKMKQSTDPIGPDNDAWIDATLAHCDEIIVCWGYHGVFMGRDRQAVEKLRVLGKPAFSFGLTPKSKQPRHPSRLPNDAELEEFIIPEP